MTISTAKLKGANQNAINLTNIELSDACKSFSSFSSFKLTLIQKGGLCSFRLLPLMREFSVVLPLKGVAAGKSGLGAVFLKDYTIMWKIKLREMKTK